MRPFQPRQVYSGTPPACRWKPLVLGSCSLVLLACVDAHARTPKPTGPINSELRIVSTMISEVNDVISATVVIHNEGRKALGIRSIHLEDCTGTAVASEPLMISSVTVSPGAFEYAVVKLRRRPRADDNLLLDLGGQERGPDAAMRLPLGHGAACADEVLFTSDLKTMYAYFISPSKLQLDQVDCKINGRPSEIQSVASIPRTDGQCVICLEIEPSKAFRLGDRVFWEATSSKNGMKVDWVGKVFAPFFVGLSQHDYYLRVVHVDTKAPWLELTLYNESDVDKKPCVVDRVYIDGVDITEHCMLPDGPIPPDFHRYEDDARKLLIPSPWGNGDSHVVEVAYHLIAGLRNPAPVDNKPYHLIDVVRKGLSLPIGQSGGPTLRGCVCLHYGELRPPITAGAVNRLAGEVRDIAPLIPAYARLEAGAPVEYISSIARSVDFLVISPGVGLWKSPSTAIAEFLAYLDAVRQHAASPFVVDVGEPEGLRGQLSPEDYVWSAMAAISKGSKGVLFRIPGPGDSAGRGICEHKVNGLIHDLTKFENVLSVSANVDIPVRCDTRGIAVNTLLAGPDQIMIFLLNEWCTRSSLRRMEPFYAIPRAGCRVTLDLGPEWRPKEALDLFAGNQAKLNMKQEGVRLAIDIPTFEIARAILLVREGGTPRFRCPHQGSMALLDKPGEMGPLRPVDSPFVDLGQLEVGTTKPFEISVRNDGPEPILIATEEVSNPDSLPVEVRFLRCEIPAHEEMRVRGEATASNPGRTCVNRVHVFQAGNPANGFYAFVDARTYASVEASPRSVDFGYYANSESEECYRSVGIEAPRTLNMSIKSVTCADMPISVQVSENLKAFRFRPLRTVPGPFGSHLEVKVQLDGEEHLKVLNVPFGGYLVPGKRIYVRPSKLVVPTSLKAVDRVIRLADSEGIPFKVKGFSSGASSVGVQVPTTEASNEQTVHITIGPSLQIGQYKIELSCEDSQGMAQIVSVPLCIVGAAGKSE
jgi:hypothetical protein